MEDPRHIKHLASAPSAHAPQSVFLHSRSQKYDDTEADSSRHRKQRSIVLDIDADYDWDCDSAIDASPLLQLDVCAVSLLFFRSLDRDVGRLEAEPRSNAAFSSR